MILILYFGHTGTTKWVAECLKEQLENVELLDGRKQKISNLMDYDTIILGTNIRMGKLNKHFVKWLKKYKTNLNSSIFAYAVGADSSKKKTYLTMLEQILPTGSASYFVGGRLDPSAAKGLSKKVIESCIAELKKRDLELPSLSMSTIEQLAAEVKKKAEQVQPSTMH